MLFYKKLSSHSYFPLSAIVLLLWVPLALQAQQKSSDSIQKNELVVALNAEPPYIIKDKNGNWDGISVRLWRKVADKLHYDFQFQEISSDSTSKILTSGKADIVLLAEVTPNSDSIMDFSHIYHTAQMGVASSGNMSLSSILRSFFSKRFWYIAGVLSVLLLIVGSIMYFVERKSNEDNFGGERSVFKGIGSGFWWAGVTMTTIGYGDKAPVTFFGRAIALLWMLVAMAITAVLTASLVSAVMGSSAGKIKVPNGLRSKEVIAVKHSKAAAYLEEERISYEKSQDLYSALEKVNKKEAELALHHIPALRYTLNNNPQISLRIQPVNIDANYYAFGFSTNSHLIEPINLALLNVIQSSLWQKELDRFIPENDKK